MESMRGMLQGLHYFLGVYLSSDDYYCWSDPNQDIWVSLVILLMTCCFLAVVIVMVMEWIVQMGFLISISSQPKAINTKKIRASSTPKKTKTLIWETKKLMNLFQGREEIEVQGH